MTEIPTSLTPALDGPPPVSMETQRLGSYATAGLVALDAVAPLATGIGWWETALSGWLLAAAAVLFAVEIGRAHV